MTAGVGLHRGSGGLCTRPLIQFDTVLSPLASTDLLLWWGGTWDWTTWAFRCSQRNLTRAWVFLAVHCLCRAYIANLSATWRIAEYVSVELRVSLTPGVAACLPSQWWIQVMKCQTADLQSCAVMASICTVPCHEQSSSKVHLQEIVSWIVRSTKFLNWLLLFLILLQQEVWQNADVVVASRSNSPVGCSIEATFALMIS